MTASLAPGATSEQSSAGSKKRLLASISRLETTSLLRPGGPASRHSPVSQISQANDEARDCDL